MSDCAQTLQLCCPYVLERHCKVWQPNSTSTWRYLTSTVAYVQVEVLEFWVQTSQNFNLLLYTARPWTRPGPAPFSTVKIVVWTRPRVRTTLSEFFFRYSETCSSSWEAALLIIHHGWRALNYQKTTPQGGPGGSSKLYLQVSSWSSTRIVIKVWHTYIGWNVP